MGDMIADSIEAAIEAAQKEEKSRRMSLVITKLEEALLWYRKEEK